MSRISHIDLDDSGLPVPTAEIEQERKVAMFDLLENNSFALPKREDREVHRGRFASAFRSKNVAWCLILSLKTKRQQVNSTSRLGHSVRS